MFPITLQPSSFQFGLLTIPYADVAQAGVGRRRDAVGTHNTLLIAHGASNQKLRLIAFGLQRGVAGERLAAEFAAHIPGRWRGESEYFAMKKTLGFSSRTTFIAVALVMLFAILALMFFVMMKG